MVHNYSKCKNFGYYFEAVGIKLKLAMKWSCYDFKLSRKGFCPLDKNNSRIGASYDVRRNTLTVTICTFNIYYDLLIIV